MRILFFSNWFPPVLSGSSFYTSSLAQALAGRGHDVQVVTLDWGDDAPPVATAYPVHCLPCRRLPKTALFFNAKRMGWSWTPGNRRRLLDIVRSQRTDVLHHVNHIFDSTLLTASVARRAGIPLVGSITTPIQHEKPVMHALMSLADRIALGPLGVCRWDGIVSLDLSAHTYVARRYGRTAEGRSRIIPFGVRLEAMPLYETRPPRSEHPQVLFVGHIHPFRNPTQLVRAMAIVRKTIPNARLVLAGRVDMREPIETAAKLGLGDDAVLFRGETGHADVIRLMQTSHAFASWATGPYPGLGTAPMEAMLCETPVINDLPENLFGEGNLRDGQNIVLVNGRDPQSVADALLRLLSDAELRARIGAAGRRFVLECLSWDRIAAQVEDLYKDVLARRAPAKTDRL